MLAHQNSAAHTKPGRDTPQNGAESTFQNPPPEAITTLSSAGTPATPNQDTETSVEDLEILIQQIINPRYPFPLPPGRLLTAVLKALGDEVPLHARFVVTGAIERLSNPVPNQKPPSERYLIGMLFRETARQTTGSTVANTAQEQFELEQSRITAIEQDLRDAQKIKALRKLMAQGKFYELLRFLKVNGLPIAVDDLLRQPRTDKILAQGMKVRQSPIPMQMHPEPRRKSRVTESQRNLTVRMILPGRSNADVLRGRYAFAKAELLVHLTALCLSSAMCAMRGNISGAQEQLLKAEKLYRYSSAAKKAQLPPFPVFIKRSTDLLPVNSTDFMPYFLFGLRAYQLAEPHLIEAAQYGDLDALDMLVVILNLRIEQLHWLLQKTDHNPVARVLMIQVAAHLIDTQQRYAAQAQQTHPAAGALHVSVNKLNQNYFYILLLEIGRQQNDDASNRWRKTLVQAQKENEALINHHTAVFRSIGSEPEFRNNCYGKALPLDLCHPVYQTLTTGL